MEKGAVVFLYEGLQLLPLLTNIRDAGWQKEESPTLLSILENKKERSCGRTKNF